MQRRELRDHTYTHAKQSGGVLLYARVRVDVEHVPLDGGIEFVDASAGGGARFVSAFEAGVREMIDELRGSDVRVTLREVHETPDAHPDGYHAAGRAVIADAFGVGP